MTGFRVRFTQVTSAALRRTAATLVIQNGQDIVDNAGRLLLVRLVVIQHPGDTELVGAMGDDRSPATVGRRKYRVGMRR